MNTTSNFKKNTKSRFVLTRKNQKGQVAIFVALIFQVIFIFFALLINVGLVVHHKINLQHSVDLAAYYGAMKQAESMNAIAHINFQLRQNWKLFTWRYRVLGTFGFQRRQPGFAMAAGLIDHVDFPFQQTFNASGAPEFRFHGSFGRFGNNVGSAYQNGGSVVTQTAGQVNDPSLNCAFTAQNGNPSYIVDGSAIGPHDIPFFCIGHGGFAQWAQDESNCQLDCKMFTSANPIRNLPNLPTQYNTAGGGNLASAAQQTMNMVNASLAQRCQELTKTSAVVLSRFMVAYANESLLRTETIKVLAKNLSLPAADMLDIEGKKILDGAKRTLENNLTGANFTGLDQASVTAYNGLSDNNCSFKDGRDPGQKEFLKIIDFNILNLFLMTCETQGAGGAGQQNYQPQALYSDASGSGINPIIDPQLNPDVKAVIQAFLNPESRFNVGYEKNPNCVEYFAVKATSEPTIPFLPLSKIKLDAVAVAKPFGGSIGPSFGKTWPKGSPRSVYDDADPLSRIDKTLPQRGYLGAGGLKQSIYQQPNFSLFVGDRLGARNLDYLAANHSMLAKRDIAGNLGPGYVNQNLLNSLRNGNSMPPFRWPTFNNWDNLDTNPSDFKDYDSLASVGQDSDGMRAIEISAITPNQFDITYYSIDPDFYNNYYVKLYDSFDRIKNASGLNTFITKDNLRGDFGISDPDPSGNNTPTPLNLKTFSVKDQILLKNTILSTPITIRAAGPVPQKDIRGADQNTYLSVFNFLVNTQSSLLSGWTFKQYNNYGQFPEGQVNMTDNTMAFGQCIDDWNNTQNAVTNVTSQQNFKTPSEVSNGKPPVAGNCVTGGRTGYSVKIIAPSRVLQSNQNIENPIDQSFFNF